MYVWGRGCLGVGVDNMTIMRGSHLIGELNGMRSDDVNVVCAPSAAALVNTRGSVELFHISLLLLLGERVHIFDLYVINVRKLITNAVFDLY